MTAPELFAAVLDEIPVSDQLRIENTPNGLPNVPEFGSVKTQAGFTNLFATSPVQHVVPGTKYPAVMLTTGINDPRVDPWQAAKMAATLQDATASGKPILLRVDYQGGHGLIGGDRTQGVALGADEYAFRCGSSATRTSSRSSNRDAICKAVRARSLQRVQAAQYGTRTGRHFAASF